MLSKAFGIENPDIGITSLPNLPVKAQVLSGTKREASFDELHRFLEAGLARNGHENVDVIGHDYEIVNCDFAGAHVRPENLDQ